MRWLTNFYDSRSKWTATAEIGIHPTKAWLSQLVNFKNAIWHFRRTICNKIVLNLEKIPQKHMECFRLLFNHLAWIEHQILSGIRDSRKAGSLWEMMRGVEGVRKSIHHSWLAKGLGLGLLCWGFKGVQNKHSSNRVSSISSRTIHQSTTPSLSQTIWARQCLTIHIVQTLLPVTFGYSLSSEAVVMRQLTRLIASSRLRCSWCNGYHRRKWTRWHEFKSSTKLIAFHIVLIPLGKVWIQLFSLQLWVNSRAD